MKIWIGTVLAATIAFILFGFDFDNFQKIETSEKIQNKIDALRWKELCTQTECDKFPPNYVTFVMKNGVTLFVKKIRCCSIDESSFYDSEFNRRVILDVEQFYFNGDDFKEMGIYKYNWPSHAKLYFSSSEKILYKNNRELILGIILGTPYDTDLSLNRSFENLKDSNFSLIHQTMNNTAFFSLITTNPMFFNHRLSISCNLSCKIISYDFEEGPLKTGVHVYNLIDQTIPKFSKNCMNNNSIENCSEFSLNEESYYNFLKDIENLYKYLQLHPNLRGNNVSN